MLSAGHELPPQKSLQIKQDDKFFSRLLSKETSVANSSCRVYYGGAAGAIPFTWESQPGTPKHAFSDISIPPLTPPPSYHFNSDTKLFLKTHSKPNILRAIFPRLAPRKKALVSPSLSSSASWSSSTYSYSSASTNQKIHARRRSFSCSRLMPAQFGVINDHEDDGFESPTSTLCFGVKRKILSGFRGREMVNMKINKLLSIVAHGSGLQGSA